MADANFYDDTSLSAEEKADTNKSSEGKRGKLANLLTIWVSGLFILALLIDILYVSVRVETPPPPIVSGAIVIGYGIILFVILLSTVKDVGQEIRKLFQ